jgi:hypothetical protein
MPKNDSRSNVAKVGLMTIRIFVGCSANSEDAEAQAMLEYTLRIIHWTTR